MMLSRRHFRFVERFPSPPPLPLSLSLSSDNSYRALDIAQNTSLPSVIGVGDTR